MARLYNSSFVLDNNEEALVMNKTIVFFKKLFYNLHSADPD